MQHAVGKPASESGAVDALGTARGTGSGAKYECHDYAANLTALTSAESVMVQEQYSSLAPQSHKRTHTGRVGSRDPRTRLHRRHLPDLGYIGTNPRT